MLGDGRKPLDLLRVHNRQVQASLRAVIQKNRVHYFTRTRRQSKRNVGNTEDRPHIRQRLLDQPDTFHRLDRPPDVILISRRAREDQRIENDVLWAQSVLFREQFVRTLCNRQLPLARERLRLQLVLIDAADHNRRAEFVRNRHHSFEFLLAVLQVDGIDDGFALTIRQRQLDRCRIGGINHQRRLHFTD